MKKKNNWQREGGRKGEVSKDTRMCCKGKLFKTGMELAWKFG